MITNALGDFCRHVAVTSQIGKSDVCKLQHDVLPYGLIFREEAEALIAMDQATVIADPSWADFFVASLVEFVVWSSRPTGYVDEATARWLIAALAGDQGATATARRAAFEIVREAEHVHESLVAFAMSASRRLDPREAPLPQLAA